LRSKASQVFKCPVLGKVLIYFLEIVLNTFMETAAVCEAAGGGNNGNARKENVRVFRVRRDRTLIFIQYAQALL
jgi:hypothetical protein